MILESKRKSKLMIVDDDLNSLNSLNRALSLHGYDTEYFNDPTLALKKYKTDVYDVVITDYKMPEMDGLALIKAIRNIDPRAKIIMFSGYIDTVLIDKVTELKIEAIYHKPLPLESFLAKLEILLAQGGAPNVPLQGIPLFMY